MSNYELQYSFLQQPKLRLHHGVSRKTPVWDSLDGIGTTYTDVQTSLKQGRNVDVFVVGMSAAGKSAVSEQLIQKILDDNDFAVEGFPRRRGRRQEIAVRYYNFSMVLEEGRRRGILTSTWGNYTPEEHNTVSKEVGRRTLEETEQVSSPPLLRVVEKPAVEAGRDTGRSSLEYAGERLQRDSGYQAYMIGLIAENPLLERNIRMREQIAGAQSREDLDRIFAKYHIAPDEKVLDVTQMQYRMGPASSVRRIRDDVFTQIVTRQEDIRLYKVDQGLPHIDSPPGLAEDNELAIRSTQGLYRLKSEEWGLPADKTTTPVNRLLPRRRIPYYGSMRKDPRLSLLG